MKSRVAVARYDRKGKQRTWSQSRPETTVANILDLGHRRASSSAECCDAVWDEADPKSEVVAAALLEMGAPSVTVPEVGVNI